MPQQRLQRSTRSRLRSSRHPIMTLLIGILTLFGLLPATAPDAAAQTAPGRLSQACAARRYDMGSDLR
jgi:hypothetical protein